jgi:hypothetical protein
MTYPDTVIAAARKSWRYLAASVLLLAPCFWQPRLQAGDLSSHIYNAWLVQLIESGKTSGLAVERQSTNILFDLMLSGLYRALGAEAAQRIAVSAAVLTFVWGVFTFIAVVSGRRPWGLMPAIAMLAYGWVFHMGFFNFYLSFGLSMWALALAWNPRPLRVAAALPILALAYVAHALPVLWTSGLMGYLALARGLAPRKRALLTAASVAALAALHALLSSTMYTRWSPIQLTFATGVDQLWVFDSKYYVVMMGLLAVFGLLFVGLVRSQGARSVASGLPFQLCVISAAAVLALPGTMLIPGYYHALSYIAERMSLGVAVCLCALLGAVHLNRLHRVALFGVAIVYFVFLYHDERALNRFEDRMQDAVGTLDPGQRVVSAIGDPNMRVNALTHMIDRACIGRCYSYANYEASTRQFRVRALAPNPVVASTYAESWYLQTGTYVVKPRDLPLYRVGVDRQGQLVVRKLEAGTETGSSTWRILPDWLGQG